MYFKNNPFNIRYSGKNIWLGQEQPKRGFCTFDTLDHGIRAYFIVMRSYIVKHHLTRLCDIIGRFAPFSENDTLAYLMFVCGEDFLEDTILDSKDKILLVAQRMAMFETSTSLSVDQLHHVINYYHVFDNVFGSR